jgi:hypothetical protein
MNSRRRISDLLRLDRQPIAVEAACLALISILFRCARGGLWPTAAQTCRSGLSAPDGSRHGVRCQPRQESDGSVPDNLTSLDDAMRFQQSLDLT